MYWDVLLCNCLLSFLQCPWDIAKRQGPAYNPTSTDLLKLEGHFSFWTNCQTPLYEQIYLEGHHLWLGKGKRGCMVLSYSSQERRAVKIESCALKQYFWLVWTRFSYQVRGFASNGIGIIYICWVWPVDCSKEEAEVTRERTKRANTITRY